MASQSSVDDMASTDSGPTTPQLENLEVLKAKSQSNNIRSSAMAAGSSSARRSITPPPSSQPPTRRTAQPTRSLTPLIAAQMTMSSPPPSANGVKREVASPATKRTPTAEEIAVASKEELAAMLTEALAANTKLDAIASEARMSAAHHKLQYRLLAIESEEALKRMEVEHDITRREVEVLQGTGRESTNLKYIQEMKGFCKTMEDEVHTHRRRLGNAKKLIEEKDNQIADHREEIGRLYERIRQNREHINIMRSPGGPLHPGSSPKTPATSQSYRGTPRYTPGSQRQIRYPPQDHQERFNALVLAGESVLSQENNSAPTTPVASRHPDPRTPNRHNRAVQSLSSFSTAPGTATRPMTSNSTLLPAPEFSREADDRVAQHALQQLRASQSRRRKSRDSTISASDHEEILHTTQSYRQESEDVHESQASQSATEMLRADPRESFEVAASRTHTPLPDKPDKNLQAKLFAPVSKVGVVEKRKRDEFEVSPAKKARMEGEGIGLGIDY